MKIVWQLDGNVVPVDVLQLWDWNRVPPRWIRGDCKSPPLHSLFNPDAGSRTLVSKQLHVLVCLLLISFMKTKARVVLIQQRFEVLLLWGFCYLFSVVLDCEQVIVSKGTRIYVRGYDAQMFGQVNFHVNKLNIIHIITNSLAVILILWGRHMFPVFVRFRLDHFNTCGSERLWHSKAKIASLHQTLSHSVSVELWAKPYCCSSIWWKSYCNM